MSRREGARTPAESGRASTVARHTLRSLPAVTRVLVPLPRIRVMRRRAVVLCEQIQAEIAVEFPPHRMDVVGVVLRVVVLDEERRALNAVVVPLSALETAHPRKLHLAETSRAH